MDGQRLMTPAGHGYVTMDWADGSYAFRLAYGQWFELQEKCNAGPLELYERLLSRKWRMQDLRETIRLGLIGGGTAPADALRLVGRYVDDRPLLESVPVAMRIIAACVIGPVEDAPQGEAETAKEPETGESPLPLSTATVQ